jgi:tetratricopeptide (TPR) repeat protein
MRFWTQKKDWTGPQKKMMRKAGRYHAVRGLAVAILALVGVVLAVSTLAAFALYQREAAETLRKEKEKTEEQRAAAEARFELAQKAIALFHTGVSEDMLLKNAEFKELRRKLLEEAAGFYDDLKTLLARQTDAKSRKALAAAYFQLAELTDKIGSKPKALAVHRQALAVRRELTAVEGADVETRLDVARSLEKVGRLLRATGDNAGALAAHEEQCELAERQETEHPSDAVRAVLAQSHDSIGLAHSYTGKRDKAMVAYRKALDIWQKLADANPAVNDFQGGLASTHDHIGTALIGTGKPEEALTAYRKALAIRHKLADANPAVTEFQYNLWGTYNNIGILLMQTGKPVGALEAHQKALAILRDVADANPAVNESQYLVAWSLIQIGDVLSRTAKSEEAMEAYLEALAINQKLSDANPSVLGYQRDLARPHNNLGRLLARQKRFAEAFPALDSGLAIRQKLVKGDPNNMEYASELGYSHADRGWALLRSGQPSKAVSDLRRAVDLWAKVPGPDPEDVFERSRALALLAGLGVEAKSGVTAAEAAMFAGQAVTSLRDAFSAGWNWPDELKEPDFDALRGREDFQKLLAELEAKPKAK